VLRLSQGQAFRPLAGQSFIGDAAWVHQRQDGLALVAVIDGLGHGHEAALAAAACIQGLEQAKNDGIIGQFARCHELLQRTRGAAMSLAGLDLAAGRLSWSGVGNVEGYLMHGSARERLLLKGGIVGYNLTELRVSDLPLGPGDLMVLATDGIQADFSRGLDLRLGAQDMADDILKRYARDNDDALVWV